MMRHRILQRSAAQADTLCFLPGYWAGTSCSSLQRARDHAGGWRNMAAAPGAVVAPAAGIAAGPGKPHSSTRVDVRSVHCHLSWHLPQCQNKASCQADLQQCARSARRQMPMVAEEVLMACGVCCAIRRARCSTLPRWCTARHCWCTAQCCTHSCTSASPSKVRTISTLPQIAFSACTLRHCDLLHELPSCWM